ncbi:MAG: tRNA epoxyqueuosine(34) reductase QueG [Anaerolineales bacterium]|nr:tRNA epoxyqueuosine(34) reductase QueG [Anaerolineales bacterium]
MNGLKESIKVKARQLGFTLAGVTSAEPPANFEGFQAWLTQNQHGEMSYLGTERSLLRRANPKEILPECRSILFLAIPYTPIAKPQADEFAIAAYALGEDYHDVLPEKLQALVTFIEESLGRTIPNRYYTDTGPVLEKELAQRAGLGWIGKNSLLINPKAGSTFILAEILLGIELEPDEPFAADHCGTCTRCLTACPTQCILPNRTLDARRCISYLTIENKKEIPEDLRPQIENWIFGCDICQQVCPWNRFSLPAYPAFEAKIPLPVRTSDLLLTPVEFNQRFKKSPIQRSKRRGYLRNLATAMGNRKTQNDLPTLKQAQQDQEVLVQEHATWAIGKIENE